MAIKKFNEHDEHEKFTKYMWEIFPGEEKALGREGMLKAYEYFSEHRPVQTYSQNFIDYMWYIYPNDLEELPQREGMMKAQYFLSGQYHQEQKQLDKIRQQISDKMNKMRNNE